MKHKIPVIQLVVMSVMQFFMMHISFASDDVTNTLNDYYPDYQLVEPALFFSEIIKDHKGENPALVIGRFNDDDVDDFVALLRSRELKIGQIKQPSREYFDGKLVVCHGGIDARYNCQVLSDNLRLSKTYGAYIVKKAPGEIRCVGEGSFTIMKNKNETISHVFWNRAVVDYIYFKKDGKYIECISGD